VLLVRILLGAVGVVVLGVLVVFMRTGPAMFTSRRQRAALTAEGIVREGVSRRAMIQLTDYTRRERHFRQLKRNWPCRLILTRQSFTMLFAGSWLFRVPLAELRRYTVAIEGGDLMIASSEPFEATGHFETRIPVEDAAAWAKALAEVGAIAA
jgi:hypothetical protein